MLPFCRLNAIFSYKREPYRTKTRTIFRDFNIKNHNLMESTRNVRYALRLETASVKIVLTENGRLRYGRVRYGTVSFGTVRYATLRYGTVGYGTVGYGTVGYGTVGYGTVRYATVRYATLRYATVRYGTVRYATVRYGTLRYGTLRYATVHHTILARLTGCILFHTGPFHFRFFFPFSYQFFSACTLVRGLICFSRGQIY
jgi:hypothetical protein